MIRVIRRVKVGLNLQEMSEEHHLAEAAQKPAVPSERHPAWLHKAGYKCKNA